MTSFYRPKISYLPEMDLVAEQVYAMSGLGPDDIDVAIIYDAFSSDRAVAARVLPASASSARARTSSRTATSGSAGGCPCNTHGGQLSEAYIHGMNGVNEGVRLIRGTSHQPAQEERSRARDRRRRRAHQCSDPRQDGLRRDAENRGTRVDNPRAGRPAITERIEDMREAVIVEALRTPIARGKTDQGRSSARFIRRTCSRRCSSGVVQKAGIDPGDGRADHRRLRDPGRRAVRTTSRATRGSRAATDYEVLPAPRVDCQCGSSQQANHLVSAMIKAGQHRRRHRLRHRGHEPRRAGRQRDERPGLLPARTTGRGTPRSISSRRPQRIAKNRGITRQECDELALRSQSAAKQARDEGRFKREILPIEAPVLGETAAYRRARSWSIRIRGFATPPWRGSRS